MRLLTLQSVCFLSVIIKTVVSSATATEYAAAFIVAQAAISIINTLADLGYPQLETEIFCDNKCAVGLANNTFNLKRTKTIDMRYHWIRDQVKQKVFKVTWKAGKLNLADFFTKAHPVKHHYQTSKVITISILPQEINVCDNGYVIQVTVRNYSKTIKMLAVKIS